MDPSDSPDLILSGNDQNEDMDLSSESDHNQDSDLEHEPKRSMVE